MSFGLKITEPPILEMDKEDWVNYNGIMMPKNTARAKKAWATIKAKEEKKLYDRNKKNKIRNEIVKIIKNNCEKHSNILTMDTKKFLFANSLQDYNFILCEKDMHEYKQMKINKPSNVKFLHQGNIEEVSYFNKEYAVVYLDFCCTFETAKKSIKALFVDIRYADYFGFTFCLRKNKKTLNDYKFDMIKKIQELLDAQPMPTYNGVEMKMLYKLVYGEAYRDDGHAPMLTIFYINNTKKYISNYLRSLNYEQIEAEAKNRGIVR